MFILLSFCKNDIKLDNANIDNGFYLYINIENDCFECIKEGIKLLSNYKNVRIILEKNNNIKYFINYVKSEFNKINFDFLIKKFNIDHPSIIYIINNKIYFSLYINNNKKEMVKLYEELLKFSNNIFFINK